MKDWEGLRSACSGPVPEEMGIWVSVPMNHATSSRKLPEADMGVATVCAV